jgi:hypothetical protein
MRASRAQALRGPGGLPRSEALEEALAESGILPVSERSRQGGKRQRVEIALASLEREFRLGETLASTLMGF